MRPWGRRGYTMPEMVVTTSILGLISLMAAPLMTHTSRFFLMNRARVEIQRDARAALSIMTRTIRQAQSSTIVIDQGAGQPYYSRVTFSTVDGKNIRFEQQANRLLQTVNGATLPLTDKVRFLGFYFPKSDDMAILSVSMTLERETYQGQSKALHVASEKVRVMD